MNYIELFAGCGGLSLGLKSTGFNLVLANELSPMAAESYAYNLLDEDLLAKSKTESVADKTLWLSSQYQSNDLRNRLRENPKLFPVLGAGCSDLDPHGENLSGKLVVGSIVDLNTWLESSPKALKGLKSSFGSGAVDLIAGGPPCQSFSMAGLRQKDSERNTLPWEFAKLANNIKPKIVLLENVTGILRPFTDKDGKSFYAWFELAKAFSSIGYIPLCLHVNAKYAGVPQNRPRFILLGVRLDVFKSLQKTFNGSEQKLFSSPLDFFKKMKKGEDVSLPDLTCWDVSQSETFNLFKDSFLRSLVVQGKDFVSVSDAIDDLRKKRRVSQAYTRNLSEIFGGVLASRDLMNHEMRSNSDLVKRRFRLYQILEAVDKSVKKSILGVLKGESSLVSDEAWAIASQYDFLLEDGSYATFISREDFISFLKRHQTRKQTQRALIADQPAPAALSIPDDACHYHHDELRTLTVREMARIQSFPDSFEFRSKVTTGGQMRSFEVPQYTQVGNAVPPLLGRALGLAICELLGRVDWD